MKSPDLKLYFTLFIKLSLVVIALSLIACGSHKPDDYVKAPAIDFNCSFAQALGCDPANVNKDVLVRLYTDLTITCGDGYPFDFSAKTQTQSLGSVLTGVASEWVNAFEMPLYSLPRKPMKVCAFIDLNGNGELDSLEPFSESTLTIGSDFNPLENWTDY